MEFAQVFTDEDVKQEFLDRFGELTDAAQLPGGGLEGLDAGPGKRSAEKTVDAMAEGAYEPDGSGLEAIVQRFTRPVHLVHAAAFEPPADNFPESETIRERLAAAAGRLSEVIPSSGRIDLRNHQGNVKVSSGLRWP